MRDALRRSAAPLALIVPGGLFAHDLADALREGGYRVWPLPATRVSREESVRTIRRSGARLVLNVNHVPGLPEACTRLGVDSLTWEIDPSLDPVPPARGRTERARVFSYRESNVAAFRRAGFVAAPLPLCANPRRRAPRALSAGERERYGARVLFVGASLRETAARNASVFAGLWRAAGLPGDPARALARLRADQAEDFARFVVPEHLAAWPALGEAAERHGLDLANLVGEIVAADKRMAWCRALLPLGLRVWGDEGWAPLGEAWRGPAGHRRELTLLYNAARVHVDVGRLYQPDIVTMRVFDVLACGGLVVTEDGPALRALFAPDEHLLAARGLDALRDRVAWALEHPAEADEIAARGRAHVLAHHTVDRRLETMLAARPPGAARRAAPSALSA